jgi:hypothetical protein
VHAHMATSCSRQRRLESPKNSRRSQLLQCRSQTVATAVSVLLLWQLVAAQSPQIVPPTVAAAAAPFHPGERIDQHADRHDHRPAGAALAAPFHNITGTFRGAHIITLLVESWPGLKAIFQAKRLKLFQLTMLWMGMASAHLGAAGNIYGHQLISCWWVPLRVAA